MSLTKATLEKRAISYFAIGLLLIGGIFSFFSLGQLEDPTFTIKTAAIQVRYPGATPEQVELEVVDLIETKIQEMVELKNISSMSRPGEAIIIVDIKNHFWSDRLPQVWNKLRSNIRDIEDQLPPGAHKPIIRDDFGFVFGFLLGVSADGFSYSELESYVKDLRKELQIVDNVARVDFWGVQPQVIYLEVAETQLSQLGIRLEDIAFTLSRQNLVVDAGSLDFQSQRFRMGISGEFQRPEEIAGLVITGRSDDQFVAERGDEVLTIGDIGEVKVGYVDPPLPHMRINGRPAIAIAAAPVDGVNLVHVGRALDQRIEELQAALPIGIEISKVSWQSDEVSNSVNAFLISLLQAIVIVLVILALTMGVRLGIIIGCSGLLFAILGTFMVMSIVGIDLHRISLGAMIIAMGMMVDNAIVVADGFVVRLQKGMERNAAAIEAASSPSIPLLGATIVACMAFYPIFASDYDTGEYAGSLFTVVAISLLISWVLSQTVTPLMCVMFLPDPKTDANSDPYDKPLYRKFGAILDGCIANRRIFLVIMVVALGASIMGFDYVKKMFFPDSSRTQLMIDYWQDEGSRIQDVAANIIALENELQSYAEVSTVNSFIGAGPPRFYLTVDPESNYNSYAQLIVNVKTLPDVDTVKNRFQDWLQDNSKGAMVRVRKYAVGAFSDWKFEARFSGPANADPNVLRQLAVEGMAILEASPYAIEVRTDWRQRTRDIHVEYNQEQGRWAGVTRESVSRATRRITDGNTVGLYRENDDLIPIVVRSVESERKKAAVDLGVAQVVPDGSTYTVPLTLVADDISFAWQDNIIWRWDRRRAITVQSSTTHHGAPVLMNDVKAQFEAMELPSGYTLEWGGEYDNQRQSTEALTPGFPPALVVMAFIIVALFNAFRPPLIIALLLPFVVVGMTFGLLVTGEAFGFMALLGALSLSGMMIKNAVVLLDEVNLNLERGLEAYNAVKQAAISRLTPVLNASATTVFGMIPLLQDVFWVGMAVTIMFGLAFGAILTMVLVPVLYATFYNLSKPETASVTT